MCELVHYFWRILAKNIYWTHTVSFQPFVVALTSILSYLIGVASMRQEEATASSSCNCVLVSYVNSSLNTASIIKMLHFSGKGPSPLRRPLPWRQGDTPPHLTPLGALGASTNAHSLLDISTLPSLKLKSGYALDWTCQFLLS